MPASYPGLSSSEYLSIGILSAVLLFVSIMVHELAHSIVAKRNGLKIRRQWFNGTTSIDLAPREFEIMDPNFKVTAAWDPSNPTLAAFLPKQLH